MWTSLQVFALVSLGIAVRYTAAMTCFMGQEPDPSHPGEYRWVIPVEDPCQCTEIRMGGVNTRAPGRPFAVKYYTRCMISDDPGEIQKWLGNCDKMDVVTVPASVAPNCVGSWSKYGSWCYMFNTDKINWQTAKTRCEGHNANLVTIHSQEENEFIETNPPGNEFWIGKKMNEPEWIDGTTYDWNNGLLTVSALTVNNCVIMKNGEWKIHDCDHDHAYVCKKN